jgi:hypothetical protein
MTPPARPPRRINPRAIAENLAMTLIALGVVMLMQPYSIDLYGWSFTVTLAGTVLFVVGSKLPTGKRKG